MISDPNDLASELETLATNEAVKYARKQAERPILQSEYCYWCDAKTKEGRRFCGRDCADKWERWGSQ